MTDAHAAVEIALGRQLDVHLARGHVGRDQLEDYASRKGLSIAEAERWLAPNLGYDPE